MSSHFSFKTGAAVAAIFMAASCHGLYAQDAPRAETRPREAKPLTPRIAPTDYQSQAQAGTVTIAADFAAHGVPTPDGTFSVEGYIVVEAGLYGPPGARINLSYKDFSLKVNGKKNALPAQPYEAAFRSLKDPEWEPPIPAESTSKTAINSGGSGGRGGGGGGQGDPPPPPPKMPLPLVLAMEQKVKMASIPEGERALPAAGLIFFSYGGNPNGIRSLELIYTGAAGKASLPLR
jgi:hypothetical protein